MAQLRGPGNLQTALTGNVDSTNVLVVPRGRVWALRVTNTAGATPTVKLDIQGSVDGTTYYNIPYALVATPSTFVVTQLTITSAVTTIYLLQGDQAWTYIKTVMSSNTNETLTIDLI